ncbi:MAG: DUF4340 domain-containing protein [Chthoniobacteraceae bacterium]
MNRKQFFYLLAVLLVIGGVSLAVLWQRSSSWTGKGKGDGRVLGKFDLNEVTSVVIRDASSSLTLAKKNDAWVVRERDDYPADFACVGGFIQGLWQLKPVQEVEAGPSQLPRLDLLPPAKGEAHSATLVELQGKDAKPLAALLVGKKFLKKSPGFPDDEGGVAGRYVLPVGKSGVSLVSERLEGAEVKPAAWLDKTFLRIDRIQSVTVASGSTTLKFLRDSDTAGDWQLDGLKPEEKLDPAKLPSFVSMFNAPAFADVKPANAPREGFNSTATVTTFDGFTYVLSFGPAEGENVPLAIAVSAQFPKERTPGKDEKPEDKKRLDDEFATKTKKLGEDLAKAKQTEARVYLVTKATYDALWKPREEFMQKAQPAPTPEAAPVPPVPPVP